MNLTEFADIVTVARDVLLVLILVLAILALLFLFKKISNLLRSVSRTVRNVEEVSEAISSRIVGPAAASSGVAFGAGKVAAFFLGLRRKRKGKAKGGDDDGKQ